MRGMQTLRHSFDADYYAAEYPDVATFDGSLLEHFCTVGWHEGRNPNAAFDTVSYLIAHGHAVMGEMNPYLHYLIYGIGERREVRPAATPSRVTAALFGTGFTDWVERLRPYLDAGFYLSRLTDLPPGRFDPVAHFAYRGWREGLAPNPHFDTRLWIKAHPEQARFLVNPLLVALAAEPGAYPALTSVSAPLMHDGASGHSDWRFHPVSGGVAADPQIALIRTEFSTTFYLEQYPDVVADGIDPVMHYHRTGWRERRNPSRDFDTDYYLSVNDDVAAAGVDPFWHYLADGRAEGRRPKRPGGRRRQIIDAARPPRIMRIEPTEVTADAARRHADLAKLTKNLALSGRQIAPGIVVSLSHDCYIETVGGTQILITDEQARFNAAGWSYLHVSPLAPGLALAADDDDAADPWVRLVCDGTEAGICTSSALAALLGALGSGQRHLIVHSVLGFSAAQICRLHATVDPARSFYWLHDYSSLCAGYNLLRNDVAFCHVPPPESLVCRVCVYGEGRRTHLQGIARIFAACRFTVLSPSASALELWRAATTLPYLDAMVRPHWTLKAAVPGPGMSLVTRGPDAPVTLAYVGYPTSAKGWPVFCDLVDALRHDPRYRFLHFAEPGVASLPEAVFVPTAVTAADRFATVDHLRASGVDVVLVLSPWPETFSFVAHEALVGGCSIVCLADSGNVAALVAATGRGMVFASDAQLIAFFAAADAITRLNALAEAKAGCVIVQHGTTAGLVLQAERTPQLSQGGGDD